MSTDGSAVLTLWLYIFISLLMGILSLSLYESNLEAFFYRPRPLLHYVSINQNNQSKSISLLQTNQIQLQYEFAPPPK